jgi:hypothetical protein
MGAVDEAAIFATHDVSDVLRGETGWLEGPAG